eukprot:symbB.v1.2.038106.t1/scaffold5828.1/size23302/1
MVDSIDDILERADGHLRDAAAGVQREEVEEEEAPATGPAPQPGSRLPKPQVRWRHLIDNHRTHFVPRLLVKHNEESPLPPKLLEAQEKVGIRPPSGGPSSSETPEHLSSHLAAMGVGNRPQDLALAHPYEEAPRKMLWETMEGSCDAMRVAFVICALPLVWGGLLEDLGASLGESRAQQLQRDAAALETELRATVKALPKTSEGCLASSAARYALHRLFVEKGWFVKGLQELDPSREIGHPNMSSPVVILQDQVPASVKSLFEQRLQRTGLCLSDLAMLAALLEDL